MLRVCFGTVVLAVLAFAEPPSSIPSFSSDCANELAAFETVISDTLKLIDAAFEKQVRAFLVNPDGMRFRNIEADTKLAQIGKLAKVDQVEYCVRLQSAFEYAHSTKLLDLPWASARFCICHCR